MNKIEFSVRNVRERDCAYLADLCGQLGYPAAVGEVKTRIRDILIREHHRIFVAETSEEEIIGWVHIHLYQLLESGVVAEIGGLVVNEEYRGNGVGRELMRCAEEWARGKGCDTVSLRSNVVRRGAHAFYESIGYTKVKEQYTYKKKL